MRIARVSGIQWPVSSLVSPPSVAGESSFKLKLEYRSDNDIKEIQVVFYDVFVFRYVAYACCTPLHLEAYNELCEDTESDWIENVRSNASPYLVDGYNFRHFFLYLDEIGAYEAICFAAEVIEE